MHQVVDDPVGRIKVFRHHAAVRSFSCLPLADLWYLAL